MIAHGEAGPGFEIPAEHGRQKLIERRWKRHEDDGAFDKDGQNGKDETNRTRRLKRKSCTSRGWHGPPRLQAKRNQRIPTSSSFRQRGLVDTS